MYKVRPFAPGSSALLLLLGVSLTLACSDADVTGLPYDDSADVALTVASAPNGNGAEYADVTPETLGKAIDELEKRMFRHAELLEFEEAARVRDQISKLKEQVLKM